ncbi:MAG: serine/threonine-protein kinase [Acidobacteriota bacterium]
MNKLENWEQVKGIFSAALEFDPEGRKYFVIEQCDGDEDLRGEIESWLASYAETDDFIETGVFSAESLIDNPSPMAGKLFGNFQIIREIGSGGMGTVYLAKRTDGEFEQEVALKIVRRSIADSQMVEQFRRERQILASLNHPNIAKLLDGGISEDSLPFLAMEYINGVSITNFVKDRTLDVNARLHLFLKICSAVTYAHRNLIVHRDLKPANILVTTDGEPKLLDFGLAKMVDESLPTDSTQTQTMFRALTPAYASPEQLKGGPLTTSSDIYSLGVIFHELIAGRRPFHFEGKNLDQIVRTVMGSPPRLPSQVESLDPIVKASRLKGDLDNITLMALRTEVDRRYTSVDGFANDIERHLNGLTVSARPNTYKYRAEKYLKRHSIGVTAAFLVLLTAASGVAVSLWQARRAQREKAKAEAVSSFLQTMLNSSSPDSSLQSADHELTVKDVLNHASKRLETEDLSGQPEVKAELQRIIGGSYFTLGQYDLAEQNLSAALEAQTRIYGDAQLETLQTMVMLGALWVERGDNAKADEFYRESLPKLRLALKKGEIKADYLLLSLGDFALLRRAMGDSKEAETLLREGLLLAPQLTADAQSNLNIQEGVLALTLADQGKFHEAEKIIGDKVESIRSQENSQVAALAGNLTGLANFQIEQGKLPEAAQNLNEAEAIYRRLFDKSNLQLGDNLRLQAQVLYLEGRYTEAEDKVMETLRIYRAGTSSTYINYATALTIQGQIYSRTNRTAEAEKLLRLAVQLRTENLPASNFLLAGANGVLGEFLTEQKRFIEAETLLTSSYDSLKNSQSSESPRIRNAAKRLSDLYTKWGRSR